MPDLTKAAASPAEMFRAGGAATLKAMFHTSFDGRDSSAGNSGGIVNEASAPRKRGVGLLTDTIG